jgi:hypothetical protein
MYVGRKKYHWFVEKTRKNIKRTSLKIAEKCRRSDHIIDPSYMGIFRSQVAFS